MPSLRLVGDLALGSSPLLEVGQYDGTTVVLLAIWHQMNCCTSTAWSKSFSSCYEPPRTRWRGRRCSKKASRHSVSWRDTSKLFSTLSKKGRPCPWLPSRAPSLSTCTIHMPSRRKHLCSRCHRSAWLTYALLIWLSPFSCMTRAPWC